MKLLVFVLAVVPIICSADLLGQEFREVNYGNIRERRQAQHGQYRSLSQAPSYIQQLLQNQNARAPLSHIPAQQPPQLGSGQPAQPQHLTQAQVSQYKPQVQFANAPQQPSYSSVQAKVVPLGGQQPQYRPAPNYPQAGGQQNYRGAYNPNQAPQARAQPHYSSRLPPQLQQLVQLQQNIANSIPQKNVG